MPGKKRLGICYSGQPRDIDHTHENHHARLIIPNLDEFDIAVSIVDLGTRDQMLLQRYISDICPRSEIDDILRQPDRIAEAAPFIQGRN